jgi:DNA mismatch repair ATPase MutS
LLDKAQLLEIEGGVHPCLHEALSRQGASVVPNSVSFGQLVPLRSGQGNDRTHPNNTQNQASETLLLLTGPNMGGKSTSLRMVGVLVLLAQIGSAVPAESMRLAPCEKIFTRLGASDNLIQGRSTFAVEAEEAAMILNDATPRSLVLADELGRGTSTHDGTAVAYSFIHYLTSIGCRTLFATHYHRLVGLTAYRQLHDRSTQTSLMGYCAGLRHMGHVVDDTNGGVHFTFTLEHGGSSESLGMNVARLAGIPDVVVRRAEWAARKMMVRQVPDNNMNTTSAAAATPLSPVATSMVPCPGAGFGFDVGADGSTSASLMTPRVKLNPMVTEVLDTLKEYAALGDDQDTSWIGPFSSLLHSWSALRR